MTSNSTAPGLTDSAVEGVNATINGTAPGSPTFLSFFQDQDFLLLELKLICSALGIIYLGAHASLRRPPSAAPRKRTKPGQKPDDEDRFGQGLEPADAIVFPLMAGVMLIGLYYLIQWLKDPAILNKILKYYMSTVSVASLLTLYAHGMDVGTSLFFPKYWRGRDGSLRKVEQNTKSVAVCDDVGNVLEGPASESNPLPGPLALLAQTQRARKVFWELRGLLMREWKIKLYLHGVFKEEGHVKLSHMMALLFSIGTALVYFSTSTPFLSNMLGYGMCYGSFLLLSPTDFVIGSSVLVGLFFYDIIMVFYTPYMITVATKLDVPIKLTFEAAARKSILGLGDIVIPGMLIGCALRFDLWMYYLRKVKYESTDLKIVEKDATSGELVTKSETKHREIKSRYTEAKGSWGDRLWVRGTLFFTGPRQLPVELTACQFPKTYFYATMGGYMLGMGVTLAMLLVFRRGQPALLYLVPGVLGSLFLTGLVRGELKHLWTYTEDGSLDTEDVVVDLDGDGNAVKRIGQLENGVVDTTKDSGKDKDGKNSDDTDKKKDETGKAGDEAGKKADKGRAVFLLSLEVPGEDGDEEA